MRVVKAAQPLSLLFLYSRVPLPMTRGDELTVAHLLEFLYARGHKVDFFTLDVADRPMTDDQRAWLESRCHLLQVDEHGFLQRFLGVLTGIPSLRPLQISYFVNNRQIMAAKQAITDRHYDVGYAYYIRSAEALRIAKDSIANVKKQPATFLALQLSQTLNTARLASTTRNIFERLLFSVENRLIRRYEARIWQYFSRTVLIGEKDFESVKQACLDAGEPPINNVVYGPHGVDTEQFRPRSVPRSEGPTVVMTGVMRYPPNIQAALWFIDSIWPIIRNTMPNATFKLVGRDPTPALLEWNGVNGIIVTGTVDDPADYTAAASVCVAPIRAAAGLQNKLLEYLSMARPVVATSIANHGIGAEADRDLLLADEPQAFAASVLELLRNPNRGEALGQSGRRFIEENWTWEAHFLRLEQEFLTAMAEQQDISSSTHAVTAEVS